eukprot:TRINITY_DN40_c1_g1_i10.p1 TRINITY_DN40_c1_g1~~TRINITY_DN40_c1_g1_i10.p1  ORF type:complete len:554 (+),score=226.36 TRINITY_DN40_c1_g1_i10:69-1664(+)
MLWFILKLALVVIVAILSFLIFKIISTFARYFRLKKKLNIKEVPSLFDKMGPIPAAKAFELGGLELILESSFNNDQEKSLNRLIFGGGFIDGAPWFLSTDADDLRLLVEEKNFKKLPLGYDQLKLVLGEGLVTSSGDLWKRQRRLISPLFHFHNLKSMAEIIHQDTVKGMDSIRSLKGAKTSPFDHFSALTLQIVIDCVFGGSNSGLDLPRLIHDWHVMTKSISPYFMWALMFGSKTRFLPFPSVIKTLRVTGDVRKEVRSAIQHKKRLLLEQGDDSDSTEGGDTDLITSLLKVVDPETGEKMPEDLIVDESITFLFAGHDTTSNALSWCLYFLTKHPEVVEKLRSELYSVFPDFGRVIEGEEEVIPTFDDLKQLQFFKYTLMEVMRIRPPVPFVDREAVEDCELQGVKIPAGSVVSLSFLGAHHDPRYWKDPFEFRPERFDPSNKDQEPARHAFSYLPFSAGSRNCVGQKFAMLDATLILMHIVHNFDVTSDPNEKVFMHYEGTMTPHGFHVQFHPRDLSGSSSSSSSSH